MDNLSDQMGLLSDDFIEECSEDSDDHGHSKNAPLREQDRFLPIANIAKIMKRAIPENGKVSAICALAYIVCSLISANDLSSLSNVYFYFVDSERGARMYSRVCIGVHIIYHIRSE